MGNGSNKELIKKLCKRCCCNVGGGIRSIEIAKEYIDAGANSIIVGTKASKEFLSKLPKEKVMVSLDTKDGKIATHGWSKLKEENIYEKMYELEEYCYKFLITNINVEGLNNGTDLELYSNKESLRKTYETRLATYYSRSRNELWTKGKKSGNIQNIEKIYLDCDSDTILFLVNQEGVACHRNKRTCFEV